MTPVALVTSSLDQEDFKDLEKKTWSLPILEDGSIELPHELISDVDWKPGTAVYWYQLDDNSILISDEHKEPEGATYFGTTTVEFIYEELGKNPSSKDENKSDSVPIELGNE